MKIKKYIIDQSFNFLQIVVESSINFYENRKNKNLNSSIDFWIEKINQNKILSKDKNGNNFLSFCLTMFNVKNFETFQDLIQNNNFLFKNIENNLYIENKNSKTHILTSLFNSFNHENKDFFFFDFLNQKTKNFILEKSNLHDLNINEQFELLNELSKYSKNNFLLSLDIYKKLKFNEIFFWNNFLDIKNKKIPLNSLSDTKELNLLLLNRFLVFRTDVDDFFEKLKSIQEKESLEKIFTENKSINNTNKRNKI